MFFFPFKMWPSSEHFFSLWKWILLFGLKNFALSLVLKQSFDNSKEADPCGPFIRSIELKTEFFFDVRGDVIDEILEVESFNYVSKSRKLGNNETFLLLCLQKDILQGKTHKELQWVIIIYIYFSYIFYFFVFVSISDVNNLHIGRFFRSY